MEIKNSKTGMAHEEMKQFIRNHFEEFVNKQNLAIADVNFAPDFVDHGADVPPGTAPGLAGAKQDVGGGDERFAVIHVGIQEFAGVNKKFIVWIYSRGADVENWL